MKQYQTLTPDQMRRSRWYQYQGGGVMRVHLSKPATRDEQRLLKRLTFREESPTVWVSDNQFADHHHVARVLNSSYGMHWVVDLRDYAADIRMERLEMEASTYPKGYTLTGRIGDRYVVVPTGC